MLRSQPPRRPDIATLWLPKHAVSFVIHLTRGRIRHRESPLVPPVGCDQLIRWNRRPEMARYVTWCAPGVTSPLPVTEQISCGPRRVSGSWVVAPCACHAGFVMPRAVRSVPVQYLAVVEASANVRMTSASPTPSRTPNCTRPPNTTRPCPRTGSKTGTTDGDRAGACR